MYQICPTEMFAYLLKNATARVEEFSISVGYAYEHNQWDLPIHAKTNQHKVMASNDKPKHSLDRFKPTTNVHAVSSTKNLEIIANDVLSPSLNCQATGKVRGTSIK